jgi:toxin ParE1/3/4
MSRPIFTKRAEQDVFEITTYLARDSLKVAQSFLSALEDICNLLAKQPDMGSERIFSGRIGRVRIFPISKFRKYLVFYRRTDDTVEILRVLHGAQDIPLVMDAA